MPSVEFRVHDRNSGAYLTSLLNASGRQCQDVDNDTGTGGVTLGLADGDLGHMVEGNIVRCYVDGVVAYSWVVGPMDQATVTPEEEAGEERRISGRGTLGLWADGIVYPEMGGSGVTFPPLGERRVVDVRRFDFAAVGYDDSSWAPAVIVPPPPALVPLDGTPNGWPLESQDWIWSRPRSGTDHPPGHSYFRHTFSVASATQASIYITADNGFEVFLDGEMLLSEMRTPLLWAFSRSVQVELLPGTHLIAVKAVNHAVFNIPQNPAGVAMVVVALDTSGDPTSVITSTGAGWRCADYPAEPPGMTVGRIITNLYNEARARGALTGLTLGFTATHDSAGVPWPNAPDVALPVGDDYLQVLRKLSELYCDVAMDPSSLRLDAWVSRGVDRSGSVSFNIGTNITALSHKGGEQSRTNAILGRYGDHWMERSTGGRRQEKFLELGTATSSAQAQRMTDAAIAERSLPLISTTTGWEPTAGTVPWVHFQVGDQVAVPNPNGSMVSGRVKSISLNETEDDYDFVAEIGSLESDILERLQRMARKAGHGALDGNFANATASSGGEGMADATGGFLTSATPDVALNSLTDVASVWENPPESGDFLGWNPDLGLSGMWEPIAVSTGPPEMGTTVTLEQDFGLGADPGISSFPSAEDHTHGTPLPRHPQDGYPYVDFSSGAVALGCVPGEFHAAYFGTEDHVTYMRSTITSPTGADGWGRAAAEWQGHDDGSALLFLYNDLDILGSYETGTVGNPFSVAIQGHVELQAIADIPDPAPGNRGRIYYNSAVNKIQISENGSPYRDIGGGSVLLGATVVSEKEFNDAAAVAGGAPTASASDHTHGTPLPRHPQTGFPYVDFGTTPGTLALGRQLGVPGVSGEQGPGLVSTELLSGASRTFVTSPIPSVGGGRATVSIIGKDNGNAIVHFYNDVDVDGNYGDPPGDNDPPSKPFGIELEGDFTFFRIANTPPLAPGNQAKIYFNSGVQRLQVSQNGGPYIDLMAGGTGVGTAGSFLVTNTTATGNRWTTNTEIVLTNTGLGVGRSPLAKFHVAPSVGDDASSLFEAANCGLPCAQDTWTEGARFWNSNTNGRIGLGFYVANTTTPITAVPNVWLGTMDNVDSGAARTFIIATNASGSLVERLRIDGSTGNVGIGITSPSHKLHVAGAIGVRGLATEFDAGVLQVSHTTSYPGGPAGGRLTLASPLVSNTHGRGILDVAGDSNGDGAVRMFNDRNTDGTYGDTPGTASPFWLELQGVMVYKTIDAVGVFPAVSASGTARVYYEKSTGKLMLSENGAAYVSVYSSPSATVVTGTSYGQASAVGTAVTYSRGDHSHGTPSLGTTVAAQTAFSLTSTAGTATTPSRADHTHGTPAPRHPQTGFPYVDFGASAGLLQLFRTSGDLSAALFGTEDITTVINGVPVHERLFITSPTKTSGGGRAAIDWLGFTNGNAEVKVYNDVTTDNQYGALGNGINKPLLLRLIGTMEFTAINDTPALSPSGSARLYYSAGKLKISENGGAYRDIGDDAGLGAAGTFLVTNATGTARRWTGSGELRINSSAEPVAAIGLRVGESPERFVYIRPGYIGWHKADSTRLGYMGFSDTDIPLVLENGARFTVTGGNVGIGVTDPALVYRLHVAGTIGIRADAAEFSAGLLGGEKLATYSRLFLTSPSHVNGWGRAVLDLRGFSDGTATATFYNDLDINGNYEVETTKKDFTFNLRGNFTVGGTVTNVGLSLTRTNAGVTGTIHSFIPTNNAPLYQVLYGGSWTGENVGSTLASGAFYTTAASGGPYRIGRVNTAGAFTDSNMTHDFAIDYRGFVGIGTIVPQEQLAVRIPTAGIVSTFFGPSGFNYIAIGNDKTTANAMYVGYDDAGFGVLQIWGQNAGGLYIADSGNIGIGTGSPAAKLSFGAFGGAAAIHLYDGGAAGRYGMGIQANEMQFFIPNGTHYSWNADGELQTSGTNEKMRLNASGELGLGVSPATKLHLNTGNILIGFTSSTDSYIQIGKTAGAGSHGGLTITRLNGFNTALAHFGASLWATYQCAWLTGPTELNGHGRPVIQMCSFTGGGVIIEVYNDHKTNGTYGGGSGGDNSSPLTFNVIGTVQSNGTTLTSARELKRGIKDDDTDSLDIVRRFRKRKFKWHNDPNQVHVGFVADEISSAYGGMAVYENGKAIGWKHDEMTVHLVGSVQTLADRYDELEKANKKLTERVDQLTSL